MLSFSNVVVFIDSIRRQGSNYEDQIECPTESIGVRRRTIAKPKIQPRKIAVAKKKVTRKKAAPQQPVDDAPEVSEAADALKAAQDELKKAQANYHRLREQAAEKVDEIRETTVGEMVDGALEVVRKHPGSSLLAAFAAGFMFDRWLRK